MAFETDMLACAAHEDELQQAAAERAQQEAADEDTGRAVREAIKNIPAWAFTPGVLADIAACLAEKAKALGASTAEIALGYLDDLHDDMRGCV